MLAGLLMLVVSAAAAPPPCTPAAMVPAITAAAAALDKKDLDGARQAIAPAAACPSIDGTSYAAHVLAAQIAADGGDWKGTHAALNGIGLHPELSLSARAAFLQLRADEKLGQTAAFLSDRTAILAANDARLAAAGRRIESFRAGAAQVEAYEATVTQGPFRRVVEFVATPDDPTAYPASVLLGQDSTVTEAATQLGLDKPGGGTQTMWFLDLYTCDVHSTVAMLPTDGAAPSYNDVKGKAAAALAGTGGAVSSQRRASGGCFGGEWLLPGLGGR